MGADSSGASGAAYVFVLNGTVWTQEAKLTPSDPRGNKDFGASVALSGSRALIGAFNDNGGRGAAYVFTLRNTRWVQTAKLIPPADVEGGLFGVSVSLSGKRALIGADLANNSAGSAYVFALNSNTWTLEAELDASDGLSGDFFGDSVSLPNDRALIGAPFDDNGAFGNGSAYVFVLAGTTWTQEAKLSAIGGANNDEFGWSVSLWGLRAVIGAPAHSRDRGTAYLFALEITTWTQQQELTATDIIDGDNFGFSVSLLGSRALIGARDAYVQGIPTGASYIFGP